MPLHESQMLANLMLFYAALVGYLMNGKIAIHQNVNNLKSDRVSHHFQTYGSLIERILWNHICFGRLNNHWLYPSYNRNIGTLRYTL